MNERDRIPFLSFCTICKGRLHHLRQTLPQNLEAASQWTNIEFVLLDYQSDDGLSGWIQTSMASELETGQLKYYRLLDDRPFCLSHAKNVAHLLAQGKVVCNLDADNFISQAFVAETLASFEDSDKQITYGRNSSTGRIALSRAEFIRFGGYEESLRGWGQEDFDLLSRATHAGLNKVELSRHDRFIEHSDEERTKLFATKSTTKSRRGNIQILKHLRASEPVFANVAARWGVADVVKNFASDKIEVGAESPRGNSTTGVPTEPSATLSSTKKLSIDFTTVVAVDRQHLEELEIVWPTWRRFRPEMLTQPLLLICDGADPRAQWEDRLSFIDHPNMQIELWTRRYDSQRETMLSALVYGPATWVNTPWYLKIDTDAIAVDSCDWIVADWFQRDQVGEEPVFVTSPWGYTKPADAIDRLDAWANDHPAFEGTKPLKISATVGENLVRHRRINSWCFFASTDWTRKAVSLAPDRLPIPSQDTFLWYVAARLDDPIVKTRMSRFGWRHISRRKKLRAERDRVLSPQQSGSNTAGTSNNSSPPDVVAATTPPRPLTRGVMYLLTGVSHAARLIVSLWSLRRFYDGPITVFTTRKESHAIGRLCAADSRLGVDHRITNEVDSKVNSSFLTKTQYYDPIPYEVNLHLDCDTLVTGDISPLFAADAETPFIATQYADWRTTDRKIRKRIKAWLDVDPRELNPTEFRRTIDEALADRPAINSGVFSFFHNSQILQDWRQWAWVGQETFICDEVALQILLPQHKHSLLDCRFNCSPVNSPTQSDVRIWHFHGRKHLKLDVSRRLWLPVYEDVCRNNVAAINDWTPCGDKRLEEFLSQNRQRGISATTLR